MAAAKKSRKQRKTENIKNLLKGINIHKPTPAPRDYTITDTSNIIINEPKKMKAIPDHYITAPAIFLKETGEIFSHGYSCHADIKGYMVETGAVYNLNNTPYIEGYLDNNGNFYSRFQAGEIAYQAGQIDPDDECARECLYSYQLNYIPIP